METNQTGLEKHNFDTRQAAPWTVSKTPGPELPLRAGGTYPKKKEPTMQEHTGEMISGSVDDVAEAIIGHAATVAEAAKTIAEAINELAAVLRGTGQCKCKPDVDDPNI